MEKRKLSKLTLFISRFLLIICGFLLGAYLIEGLVKLLDLTLSSPITSVIDEAVILLAEGISGVIVAVILFILAPNIVLALISFIKLIVYPLAGIIILWLLPLEFEVAFTVFIALACPAGASVVMFAQRYDRDAYYGSEIFVITTLLSAITLPLLSIIAIGVLK